MNLVVRILQVLVALGFVVLAYFVLVWGLDFLEIPVPSKILKVVFFIIGLLALIGALTGKMDGWFKWPGSP